MKIRPKQGTELEKVLTEMNVRMKQEENEAKDIIEAYCGTRPDTIGYNWAFGFTAVWNYRLIGFNDETFIPAKLLRNKDYPGDNPLYKVSKQRKEGRDLVKAWDEKFKGLDGRILSKFGIPVIDKESARYTHWLPVRDEKGVYIAVNSHLLDRMKAVKTTQFEIEI